MFTVSGKLINIVKKSEYKDENGLVTPTKAKLQILVEVFRANGTMVKELHTISIPDSKLQQYVGKEDKDVSVAVGIICKSSYSFYGV